MKKLFKVLAIIAVVVVILFVGLLVLNFINQNKSYIEENYYENFETKNSLEEKYSGLGEYEVSEETYKTDDKVIKKYRVWYPTAMSEGDEKYPLIIVTNASNTAALNIEPFFKRLASWGFIVAGNEDRQAGNGESTSKTLDYLLKLNQDKDSVFYQKIDEANIGSVGHSQGGAGALRAVTEFENSKKYKTIFTGSAAYELLAKNMGWGYDMAKVNIPYFMTASTGNSDDNGGSIHDDTKLAGICPLASLVENYEAMSNDVLKVRARFKNAEHEDILSKTDSYMTAWMLYQLKGDAEAGSVFLGENAELLNNDNWQDAVKNR